MTIDNIAIRLDLTGMLSYFYFTTAIRKWKSLENFQDFSVETKTKTMTLLFVLEAPRDQVEDYITDYIYHTLTYSVA